MVKGISKRVVLVKAPRDTMFEEAIFILKEEATSNGVDADGIMKQACEVATQYARRGGGKVSRGTIRAVMLMSFGASVMGAVWMLCTFL